MLLRLALLLCTSPGPAALTAWTGPAVQSAESAREAIRALEKGLKHADAEVRVAALQEHGRAADSRTVALVVKALRDRDRAVRAAAIEALRFSDHSRALDGLHRMATSDRSLGGDAELRAALYKAIGQHGDASSIPILSRELLVQRDRRVSRAGILSLANIRAPESVEAIFSLMHSASRNQVQGHMPSLRLALVVLTGADEGTSQDHWTTWWNDHKRGLRIAPGLPPMTEVDRRAWDSHWGIRRRGERELRRHERGTGDPD